MTRDERRRVRLYVQAVGLMLELRRRKMAHWRDAGHFNRLWRLEELAARRVTRRYHKGLVKMLDDKV